MKNKYKILVFVLSFTILSVFSQENKRTKNLILTVSVKHDVHKITNVFYWLIPYDNIDIIKNEYEIYPLYMINDFSNDKFLSCVSGKNVNLFEYTTNTNFDYDKNLIKNINVLDEILGKNKIFVQKISKKWNNRSKLKTKIYVTPVIGKFQFCNPTDNMKKRFDLDVFITVPVSDFQYSPEILKSKKVIEFLYFTDFSKYSISNRAI